MVSKKKIIIVLFCSIFFILYIKYFERIPPFSAVKQAIHYTNLKDIPLWTKVIEDNSHLDGIDWKSKIVLKLDSKTTKLLLDTIEAHVWLNSWIYYSPDSTKNFPMSIFLKKGYIKKEDICFKLNYCGNPSVVSYLDYSTNILIIDVDDYFIDLRFDWN